MDIESTTNLGAKLLKLFGPRQMATAKLWNIRFYDHFASFRGEDGTEVRPLRRKGGRGDVTLGLILQFKARTCVVFFYDTGHISRHWRPAGFMLASKTKYCVYRDRWVDKAMAVKVEREAILRARSLRANPARPTPRAKRRVKRQKVGR